MIGQTVGHYRILEAIGEGGMGAVYLAEDTVLRRRVALKTLASHLTEDRNSHRRLVREAEAASNLNHPNITTVYELVEHDGRHFISMEYVEGRTLRELVRWDEIRLEDAVDIILQVADALRTAHEKGILHRDLKSSNLMVTGEGRVKVMDFGLAHFEGRSQLTRTGTTMGTLAYSSPEQLMGEGMDRRSEIWSLGVVFYEALTGRLPFDRPTEGSLVYAILNGEYVPPSEHRADLPPSISRIIERMMSREPGSRYQDLTELIPDLAELQTEVGPPSQRIITGSVRPYTRDWRRPAAWIGAAVTAVFIGAVLLGGILTGSGTRPRLAVQPFALRGADLPEGFGESLALEVHGRLASVASMDVIEFYDSSLYPYENKSVREIGRDLAVDYLLRADIQQESTADGHMFVRLNPRLVHARSASTIWAPPTPLETAGAELFRLQSNLATQIVRALDLALSASEQQVLDEPPTENLQAYTAFQEAQRIFRGPVWGAREAALSIGLLERAVSFDPDFAAAWAELSQQLAEASANGRVDSTQQAADRARETALTALRVDPDAPSAHLAMGFYYFRILGDYGRAYEEFEQVLRLQPSNLEAIRLSANSLRKSGFWEMALERLERCRALDPLSPIHTATIGQTTFYMGRFERATIELDRYLRMDADHSPISYVARWLIPIMTDGDVQESWRLMTSAPDQVFRDYVALRGASFLRRSLMRVHWREIRPLLGSIAPLGFENTSGAFEFKSFNELLTRMEMALCAGDTARVAALADTYATRFRSDPPLTWADWLESQTRGEYAEALVLSGRVDEGVRVAEAASMAYPVERDAVYGLEMLLNLAVVYALAGRYQEATETIERLLDIPSPMTVPFLESDPIWRPLWDHPRFLAMVRDQG